MLIISSGHEKIARVNCTCCGDDEHFVDIFYNKIFDEKDPDEYLFEFEFDSPDMLNPFPPLKERLRQSLALLKNEDNYRHDEHVDSILLNPDQFLAMYKVTRSYADNILTDAEKAKIDNPAKPDFKKYYIKFKKQSVSDWAEVYFYRSKDGLALYFDNYETKEDLSKVYIHSGGIGWFIPQDTPKEYIKRYAREWFFKKSLTGMRHMYCSLNREETIDFLSALNYILTNIKQDEKGLQYVCI